MSGRIYVLIACTHTQAEICNNVRRCNVSIYLRVKDAQACRVSSTVLLPLFSDKLRQKPVAVLEVTQFNDSNTSYSAVFDWAQRHMEVLLLLLGFLRPEKGLLLCLSWRKLYE